MSALTINGIAIPIADGGLDFQPDVVGAGVTRAQDGSARNNFNAVKKHLSGHSQPMSQADAGFVMALLLGLGDHWTFDGDLYSDKGQSASTTGTAPSIVASSPSPKWGAGSLKVPAGTGNSALWSVNALSDGYAVLVWRNESSVWHSYIVSALPGGTVSVWKDGVAQSPGMPAWLAVDTSANTVKLVGIAGTDFFYDDLVVIPAQMPSDLVATLNSFTGTGASAAAWPSPYPVLQVAGDFHPVALSMEGKVGKATMVQGALAGAYANNLRRLEFELLEA